MGVAFLTLMERVISSSSREAGVRSCSKGSMITGIRVSCMAYLLSDPRIFRFVDSTLGFAALAVVFFFFFADLFLAWRSFAEAVGAFSDVETAGTTLVPSFVASE